MTQILEIKHTLAGARREFWCELCELTTEHAVILFRLRRDVDLAGVLMPAGTLSFGHYWTDRHYNVYHWLLPDGTTRAYYVNLADNTDLREDAVEWRDLVVDVLLTPDGSARVLDEDELPADLAPEISATIVGTVAHILANRQAIVAEVEAASRRFLAAVGEG
ncbi:MAG: DUF402 domain-containing protein [Chloroflexota bacterium]